MLNNLFSARENVLNNFKSRLFPIKNWDKISARKPTPEPEIEPAKHKKSKLKLEQEFMYEMITYEKDVNDGIFWNFKYPSFLAKDLVTTIQAKDEQLINNVDWLLENKFLKIKKKKKKKSRWYCQKIILNFNKQRKGKRCPVDIAKQIKILSPKQMLQRLAIAQA